MKQSKQPLPGKAVLILGMHRNGTSTLARFVNMLGYDLGSHLMDAREDNPSGFWENAEIIEFNENLLARMHSRWDSLELDYDTAIRELDIQELQSDVERIVGKEFSASDIAIKDPRLCRLWPLWESVLTNLGYELVPVVMLRHPMEVALSLQKRDAMPLARGLLLWLAYTLDMAHFLGDRDYAVIDYTRLMQNCDEELQALDSIAIPGQDFSLIVKEFGAEFLSAALYHNRAEEGADTGLVSLACRVMELVRTRAPDDLKELALIRQEVLPALRDSHMGIGTALEPEDEKPIEGEATWQTHTETATRLYNELTDSKAHAALMELERIEFDEFLADLQNKLETSDEFVSELKLELTKRTRFTRSLKSSVAKKDSFIESLRSAVDEKQEFVESLQASIVEKEYCAESLAKEIEIRSDELLLRADYIVSLQESLQAKDTHAESLDQELTKRTRFTQSLKSSVAEKDSFIESLRSAVDEKQEFAESLQASIVEKEYHAESLSKEIEIRSDELQLRADYIVSLQESLQAKDIHAESLDQELTIRTEYLESLKTALDAKIVEIKELQANEQELNGALAEARQELDSLSRLKLVRLARYINEMGSSSKS